MSEWHEVLAEAGYPTTCLMIDFESFFNDEVGFKSLSTIEYVTHDEWETLGFGWQLFDTAPGEFGVNVACAPQVEDKLREFQLTFGDSLEEVTVVAKNARFDMLVLLHHYGINPKYILDVEDLTRHYDARMDHGLKHVAKLFGAKPKGDTNIFFDCHWDDIASDPDLLNGFIEYTAGDIEAQVDITKKALPYLSNPHTELRAARHTLNLFLYPQFVYNFELADELIKGMTKEIDNAIQDVSNFTFRNGDMSGFTKKELKELTVKEKVCALLSGNLSFVKLLQLALPEGEEVPTKPAKRPGKKMEALLGEGRGPALAKDDDGCKWLLGHSDDLVSGLMIARQAVKSWPLHISRVTRMRNQAAASGGLFRIPMKYYGCHTGRWSGDEKVNTNNLGGKGRGKAINKLIGMVRHTLTAGPGHKLCIVDSGQIEARKLAWLAGQTDLIEAFADDADPYSLFAADLFQTKVWKWGHDDVEEYAGQKEKVGIYRGFGKDAILGCGYGMGANKFYDNCIKNDVLRPLFDSGEYDLSFIKKLIRTYRTKYSKIPEYWGSVENAWRRAAKYGEEVDVGSVRFYRHGSSVFMRLPSGRVMQYRHASVTAKDELRWHHGKLWGGGITENIVQASSRDLLWYWMDRIERELGVRVVHHVYDEIITRTITPMAEEINQGMIQIMCEAPDWCPDMPLSTDDMITNYYTK